MTADKIIDELNRRKNVLNVLTKSLTKELGTLPTDKLVISNTKDRIKYYKRIQPENKLIFVPKSDTNQIMQLQRANYLNELKRNATQEIELIEKALNTLQEAKDPEKAFCKLPLEKRNLIEAYNIPLTDKASFVTNHKYHAARPNSNLLTKAGERVRSKSELIIANKLYDSQVPYCYEMNTVAGELMQYNPDFTVVNKTTGKLYYWEHFGMIDDQTYGADCQVKLENLARAGIFPGDNLIMTFESSKRSLDTEYVDLLIHKYLM